jgi:hypothetical protein
MTLRPFIAFLGVCALLPASLPGQFTVTGVADKQIYNNTVTLTVGTQAGFDYSATLNWQPIAVGVPVLVNKADFYELRVDATNQVGGAVTSAYRRFIVNATERGTTEQGLPPQTPFPVIQSSPAEVAGAHLRVIAPASFPVGYEIPVVAWIVDDQNHAVRANGLLTASGQNSIQLKRGVGSGFLATNQASGILNYAPSVAGVATNKAVALETNTVWTNVFGVLSGVTTWPAQSRIRVTGHLSVPAGSSLMIGAGAVVLLNPGVNITNNGAITINGTVEEPVIFMPNSRAQPWGGFFMRTSTGSLTGNGVIFVASGADPNGGAGHRPEQCLFLVDNAPSVSLTDSAAIYLAGQLGHAYSGGTFTYTRFLLQGATTGGEYTGSTWRVNDSAFIECPDASVNFVDGDNDALYLVSGNHGFTNTVIGWTKDDGIDSGGDGTATLNYESCWFEATFHEGNSLSGAKTVRSQNTVYIDCGQGLEDGYGGPNAVANHCLFLGCQSGVRHGDNYKNQYSYTGTITVTNSFVLNNHRDVFGFNWNDAGWTNAWGQCFASNNFVSSFDTNFPNNTLWNPATEGWRLGTLGGVGRVGIGFGVRGSLAQQADGIPVGLSRFCTNEVSVDYVVDGTDGTHSTGTLVFPAGLTRRFIPRPANTNGVWRMALLNAVNADVTGGKIFFGDLAVASNPPPTLLVASNAVWKYFDQTNDLGTAWRALGYNDSGWLSGAAQLGFGENDQATTIASNRQTTTYFRRIFTVDDPAFANLSVMLLRDDAGVVFLNSNEVRRSPNLPAAPSVITNRTPATSTGENTIENFTIPATNLIAGANIVAVEMHQESITSSDVSFALSITGNPLTRPRLAFVRLADDFVIYSTDNTAVIEEASDVTGPWTPVPNVNTPTGFVPVAPQKFYRLRK